MKSIISVNYKHHILMLQPNNYRIKDM